MAGFAIHPPRAMSSCAVLAAGIGLAVAGPPAVRTPGPRLAFEVNRGQAGESVRFLSRGGGQTLLVSPTEAVFAGAAGRDGGEVRLRLLDADPGARMSGLEPLTGKVNYLIGRDLARWIPNVPLFSRVRVEAVYPGIDLVYYGNEGRLEFDIQVAAGADPSKVSWEVTGAGTILPNASGDLILAARAGQIVLQAPVIYQESEGVRRSIPGRWKTPGKNRLSIELAAYDAGRPLVIDPIIVYSTYLGGNSYDLAHGIAVDEAGNSYVTGGTSSLDFPVRGALQQSLAYCDSYSCSTDAFVAKYDPAGQLVYATYLGGAGIPAYNGFDVAEAIAVDASGSVVITGTTSSFDFPVTAGALQPTCPTCNPPGFSAAFVAKLDPAGSSLVYSTFLGGLPDPQVLGPRAEGRAVAIGPSGDIFVAGVALSGLPVTAQASQQVPGGGPFDAFAARIDPSKAGSASLVYCTYFGGSGEDQATGLAVDSGGEAVLTGWTLSADLPLAGALQPSIGSADGDAFVARLDPSGSTLTYSTYLGGSGVDRAFGVALDRAGNAHIVGQTRSPDFPVRGPLFSSNAGTAAKGDAFVTKLNAAGSVLLYSTFLGGTGEDWASDIALDDAGNAFVHGTTNSAGFPLTPNAYQDTLPLSQLYVSQFDPSGTQLLYSSLLGFNSAYESIAVDHSGKVFLGGGIGSAGLATKDAEQPTWGGLFDAFVLVLDPRAPTFRLGASTHGTGRAVITSSVPGIDCGVDCSNAFDAGSSVTLTALPDPLSTFAEWTGACTGQGSCVVALDQDKSVGAKLYGTTNLSVLTTLVPEPAIVDAPSVYMLQVNNMGWPAPPLGDASGLVATLTLPAATTVGSIPPECTFAGGGVTCAIGSLAAGAYVVEPIVATQAAAGIHCYSSAVAGNETEIHPPSNTASDCHVFNLAHGADLVVFTFDLRLDCKKHGKKCKVVGTIDLLNIGEVDAPASRLGLFVSGNQFVDPSDPLLREWKVPPLPYFRVPPPISKSLWRVHVKAKLPTGPNGLLAMVVDLGNGVPEQDEGNNIVLHGPFP